MRRFRFRPRQDCVCGAALDDAPDKVAADSPWGTVTFVRCGSCGSYVQSPQIEERSLARWYDSSDYQGSESRSGAGYHNYLADEEARLSEARARYAADLERHLPAGARILEVGCATGSLLAALAEPGHSVAGIDLSESFVAFGRRRYGLDIRCGDFLQARYDPGSFDMIVMLGTISNLGDAASHLRQARTLLKPDGILFLNLPLADSLVGRAYGRGHWMFTPSVSAFMTGRGLLALLERAGLALERMRTDRQRPSLGKLLNHARALPVLRLARRAGLAEARLPVALPVPGVAAVWARPR